MDDRRLRVVLSAIAAAMIAIAIVYAIARPKAELGPMPEDPIAIAHWLASHPADWQAASALTENALDARVPDRIALWRAARETAMHLAPTRDAPRVALARGVFFHWTEMTPADHAAALAAIAPLLRDTPTFFGMARPLYELTGDLGMLRRWQPGTEHSIELLISLALPNGDFADYRALREQLVAKRYADLIPKLPRLSPVEIISEMPPPPYTTETQPLLVAVLDELHRRPLDEDPHRPMTLDALIDYAVRHRLQPLDGLAIVLQTPAAGDGARLALANELGLSKDALRIRMTMKAPIAAPKLGVWEGPPHDQQTNLDFRGPSAITIERTVSDEVPPYVEIFVDDRRVAEGEVSSVRTFALPTQAGTHRINVRLANSATRNGSPRRVKIVSVAP